MTTLSDTLSQLLSGAARDLERGLGPEKWCRRCSRKHRTRVGCELTDVAVPAKSGRLVKRQARA